MNAGIVFALAAYTCWGLFPLYWKALDFLPALPLIGHRIVWSCAVLWLLGLPAWRDWRQFVLTGRLVGIYGLAALLIGVNWLVYVWAVNAGFIVEASLGYFINPLINVLLGVLVLGERLRCWQWVAVAIAAGGVVQLTVAHGALPWIALTLAFSFGFYALLKKRAPVGALPGLTLETTLLVLPAGLYLALESHGHPAVWGMSTPRQALLLMGTGLITTVPLLLFAAAARRIPLAAMGVLQYIAPTLQFLIGTLVYREPFTSAQLYGFGAIWCALLVFSLEGSLAYRRHRPKPVGRADAEG